MQKETNKPPFTLSITYTDSVSWLSGKSSVRALNILFTSVDIDIMIDIEEEVEGNVK